MSVIARENSRLSLSMIVRNSGTTLGQCLASVCRFVDEVIVVDTGSSDNTVAVAESFGARVFYFPWCDNFAAARNDSLRHANGDWILWIDSDDTVPPECGRQLRQWTEQPESVLGVVAAHVHCPLPEAFNVVDHIKLIRNRPELRFEGRVHEQILPSIQRAGGTVVPSDLYFVHSNADFSPTARARKRSYYLRLLEMDLADRPDDPFILFNMGVTFYEGENFSIAAEYLDRSITGCKPREEYVARGHALLADCLRRLGKTEQARKTCRAGVSLFPDHGDLTFQQGLLALSVGRHKEAIRAFETVLRTPMPAFAERLVGPGANYKARHNLALAYLESGKPSLAEREWRTIVENAPHIEMAWEGLAEALLRQSKFREMDSLADRLGGFRGIILRARSALARNKVDEAKHLAANIECGEDPVAWNALSQFYFEAGWAREAERALRELLRFAPSEAGAYHNLGVLFLATERPKEAIAAFQASLELRPSHLETQQQLEAALEMAGERRPLKPHHKSRRT